MQRDALNLKTVEVCPAYVIEQDGSPRHKIRDALSEGIYMIKRIGINIDQFAFTLFGIRTVVNRRHSMPVGAFELHVVAVGKSIGIFGDTHDTVLYDIAVFIEKTGLGNRKRSGNRLFNSSCGIAADSHRRG